MMEGRRTEDGSQEMEEVWKEECRWRTGTTAASSTTTSGRLSTPPALFFLDQLLSGFLPENVAGLGARGPGPGV